MLKAKTEEQKDKIIKILGMQETCCHFPIDFDKNDLWGCDEFDDRVYLDGDITFDKMAEVVDYLRTLEKKDELFEECWLAYDRKGSKKKAREYWMKLQDSEKDIVMPHIKAYVASRERQYRKDFERYLRDKTFLDVVSNGNNVVFDPSKCNKGAYAPQGRTIWYDENTKSYWTDDNFYYGVISDGYTDDNRPDGATLTMSNARGAITWNSLTKKWDKK